MQTFDLNAIELEAGSPVILSSDEEGRAIAIALRAGEALDDHQVHERAWLIVVAGSVEIDAKDGGTVSGSVGLMAEFAPNERHEVRATEDTRLLLLLSPWPGVGHPSRTD